MSAFRLYDRVVEAEGGGGVASTVEIVPRAETDLPQLFGFASSVFAGVPGWSDEQVLEVLSRDVVFVARERGQLAGFVALWREESGLTCSPPALTG